MGILKINEFYEINEGILSSIGSGLSKLLGGKRGEINELLKKIEKAKREENKEIIEIEKEIFKYSKRESTEDRFTLQNLNKQLRTIVSLKEREVDSYLKKLNKISEKSPELEAKISSELAKIQVQVTEEYIRSITPYKEDPYLQRLSREFDSIVRDAKEKEREYVKSIALVAPEVAMPKEIPQEAISFSELNPQKASEFLKDLPEEELEKIYRSLTDWRFLLEVELKKRIDYIENEIKRAEKENNIWGTSNLEAEKIHINYTNKKSIDKIKSKIRLVETEIKNRRYANP